MSRIGLKVVNLPAGVTVTQEGDVLTVKGPRGVDAVKVPHLIHAHIDEHDVRFTRENDMKATKQLHGTTRANFHNAVVGVTQGYKKELELVGIGYRAQMRGKDLVLFVGYSHEVVITPEEAKKAIDDFKNKLSTAGVMYDGEPLDDETRDAVLAAVELAERTARLAAKEKFTPKKYKK